MKLDLQVVGVAALITFVFGAIMPVGMRLTFGARTGRRWVQNWHSAASFMLSAYPIAFGLFVGTWVAVSPWPTAMPARVAAIAAFAVAIALAFYGAWDDFVTEDVPPVILNREGGEVAKAIEREEKLRQMPRKKRLASATAKEYASLVSPFRRLQEVRRRGSWLAWMLFLINLHGAVFVATLLWYIAMVALFVDEGRRAAQPIVVIGVLFASWFFFRRYSQWYALSIYRSLEGTFPIYFVLAFVGLAGVMAMWVSEVHLSVKVIGAAFAGISALLSLAQKFEWAKQAIADCGEWLANFRFAHSLIMYAALAVLFVAIASKALQPIATVGDSATAAGSTGVRQAGKSGAGVPAPAVPAPR